jgi:hypothetical protein
MYSEIGRVLNLLEKSRARAVSDGQYEESVRTHGEPISTALKTIVLFVV